MLAIKGNKEVKILDIHKKEYVEKGYTILDDKMQVVAKPFDKKEAKIEELEKEVLNLKTEKEKLEKKIAELEDENKKTKNQKEPTVAEIKAKLEELGVEFDKNANKETLLALLPKE